MHGSSPDFVSYSGDMSDPRAALEAPLPEPYPATEFVVGEQSLTLRLDPRPQGREPALMIHGLGGSSLNWTDLLLAMRDDVDAVAVDLPGFGFSDPPVDGDYTLPAQARIMADLIRKRGEGPVHLFGNSLGGAIGLQVAARHPDVVRSLTLISPALPQYTAQRGSVHLPVLSVPGIGERLMDRFRRATPQFRAQASIDNCFADPSRMHPQRLAEAVEEVRRRDEMDYSASAFLQSLRALLASYRDTSAERPWRLAEQVVCPTLVIHGRQDRLVDSRAAHRVNRHFADASVIVLPESGHVAQMEHPDWVAAHWRDFRASSVD